MPARCSGSTPPLRDYWPRRFTVVGLCFLSTFICYIDRVNISFAVITWGTNQVPTCVPSRFRTST